MKLLTLISTLILLVACSKQAQEADSIATPEVQTTTLEVIEKTTPQAPTLDTVLASQAEDHKARYGYRHPAETLSFFDIKPGMTVVEYLPAGGWYSQILAPFLGADGTLIGVDYSINLWPNFDWVDEKFMAKRESWPADWSSKFSGWGGEQAARPIATRLGETSESLNGTADAALYIRALHNLARFEEQGQFLTKALANTYAMLKPGGIVGVVQHEARVEKSDEWANGSNGYLKKQFVIDAFKAAGFEFVAESSINENPLDQPQEDEVVWRLPPSNSTPNADDDAKAAYKAIGESHRMTLLFKKPEIEATAN